MRELKRRVNRLERARGNAGGGVDLIRIEFADKQPGATIDGMVKCVVPGGGDPTLEQCAECGARDAGKCYRDKGAAAPESAAAEPDPEDQATEQPARESNAL